MMSCIVIENDRGACKVIESHIKKNDFLDLLQTFQDPLLAADYLHNNTVDLVFLETILPHMNGIQFINSIQKDRPQFILTTSYKEYAIEAFESGVTDYLVKPITYQRFHKAVIRAKHMFNELVTPHIDDETVFVKKGKSLIRISNSDIIFVESLGDYIILKTENDKFIIHSTMKAMDSKLPSMDYIRVHRSFIIRIDKIEKIKEDLIYYKEKRIPIGKTYRKEVFDRLKRI